MRILGIDPGIAIVGWGVIEYSGNRFRTLGYGSVQTPAGMPTEHRLVAVHKGISDLIDTYAPDCMSIEELFWNTNQTTGIRVSEARGVILLSAAQKKIDIFEYTPLQIKQALTGQGRAEKQQVQYMVKTILGLQSIPKPDDAADALAVALCHSQTSPRLNLNQM